MLSLMRPCLVSKRTTIVTGLKLVVVIGDAQSTLVAIKHIEQSFTVNKKLLLELKKVCSVHYMLSLL